MLKLLLIFLTAIALLTPSHAEQIPVRYKEGLVHGFLVLRTPDGQIIANGDLYQTVRGDQVSNHLVFHFKDGSLHEEKAVFSQRGKFRLLSDHLVQKGPSFPHPVEVSLNATSGQVEVHYADDDGNAKVITEHVKLTPDVSNGMTLTLLKNLPPDTAQATISMVASTPKPRVVKLVITPSGEEPFTVGTVRRSAMHYIIKIEIGGVAGVIAPIIGKQPANIHVWVLKDEAPAFVKMQGPLFNGGPIWQIELTSPVWPKPEPAEEKK